MPLLYDDPAEDRRTSLRIEIQKRRLAKEYQDKHGHAPSEAELNQMVWHAPLEPGEGVPRLPLDNLPYEGEEK